MTDSERMSALDFIISVLKEHEKTLDSLIGRLENISSRIVLDANKKSGMQQPRQGGGVCVRIVCENWDEFKELAREAEILSFHFDKKLRIMALHGNRIYEYGEPVLAYTGYLKNGIPVRFQAQLDMEEVRKFLLRELNASGKKIIYGKILFSP